MPININYTDQVSLFDDNDGYTLRLSTHQRYNLRHTFLIESHKPLSQVITLSLNPISDYATKINYFSIKS